MMNDDKQLAMIAIVTLALIGYGAAVMGYSDNGLATNAIAAVAGMAVGQAMKKTGT